MSSLCPLPHKLVFYENENDISRRDSKVIHILAMSREKWGTGLNFLTQDPIPRLGVY